MKNSLFILNVVALISTIVVNYLSNTGIFNGETMSSISARYENLFTPAGYAFSIWGLIYFGLIAFFFVERKNENNLITRMGWWFLASCLANMSWVIAWLYNYTGLSVLIMIALLFCLLQIILHLGIGEEPVSMKKRIFTWWPFSIYAGWVTVALIANVAAWLTKINWNGLGVSNTTWAVIMICIAGAINMLITWKKNIPAFALTGCWALIAIAVSNWNHTGIVKLTALVVAAILMMSILIHHFKGRKLNQGVSYL
jgi:hypothetical protein